LQKNISFSSTYLPQMTDSYQLSSDKVAAGRLTRQKTTEDTERISVSVSSVRQSHSSSA
jgi:hypothetical protein